MFGMSGIPAFGMPALGIPALGIPGIAFLASLLPIGTFLLDPSLRRELKVEANELASRTSDQASRTP